MPHRIDATAPGYALDVDDCTVPTAGNTISPVMLQPPIRTMRYGISIRS